jgi:hypothetical protein
MSGPHLVSVVALMWSAQPQLIGDIDRTTQILLQTARPYTARWIPALSVTPDPTTMPVTALSMPTPRSRRPRICLNALCTAGGAAISNNCNPWRRSCPNTM